MSINCSKCGAELEDNSKFCTECGEKVIMKKGIKALLIILTIIACLSIALLTTTLLGV